MSRIQRVINLVPTPVSKVVFNPFITASLLWVLTRGPPRIRDHIFETITSLRNPQTLARVVKVLKWLLALGLTGTVNRTLNELALNSWRAKSEKSRWNWNREVAVVTGGCSGLGELLVKRLINKGVKVAVLDIKQLPPSLQGYSSVKFFACDVTDPEAVSKTAEQIAASMGPPSILVNNAGIAQPHTILDTTPDYLQKIFAINVFSNWYTMKTFLPDMISKNKGHIVTVASNASYIGVAGMGDYCASKAAVLSFHESLNQELRNKYKAPNVLTTSIHPSWIRTPLLEPFEGSLRASGSPILEPQCVVDAIAEQIFKCSGGQIFLPANTGMASSIRGFPNWLQEKLRGDLAKTVLPAAQ
ncbi:dehydrogenase/reductase SDR family member 8 precursor [Lentithecium fluviatile CBS 122367]|uniref:Short-chain dehydrogenase/reductase 3 n=1 Tax=Lentithecium fluviatile CBS 122367 TaxID=1168545 RepID=A0A6G1JDH4_9PLEO|nr:dehydrogenase/reductase SDR family member 8 precursor [Lentithecium fluviatile CBS 122367]